ncbi:hypothetical protein RYX36_010682, partial [Vicia faba]
PSDLELDGDGGRLRAINHGESVRMAPICIDVSRRESYTSTAAMFGNCGEHSELGTMLMKKMNHEEGDKTARFRKDEDTKDRITQR